MPNGVKTKFAGLLRELLRRFDEPQTGAVTPQTSRPIASGAPLPADTSAPQFSPSMDPGAPAPAAKPKSSDGIKEVELALPMVLQSLPPRLHARLTLTGEELSRASISIPLNKVMPQLALGAVKITFGELRQAAPTLFNTDEEYDSLPIVLPLNEILARLNPGSLARNPAQKTVAVPDEITGPFGGRGEGISFTTNPLKPQAPVAAPAAAATPAPPIRMPTPPPAANAAPPPVAPPPPPFVSRSVTPERPTESLQNGNGNGHGIRSANGHGIPSQPVIPTAKPIIPPIPFRPAAPAAIPMKLAGPPPASAKSGSAAPVGEVVTASLAALSETWPESLRTEIESLASAEAQVALPVALIEPALKRGRVAFAWRQLRPWIRPAMPAVSVHDNLELELPLKVVAPLFLARLSGSLKTARPHQAESVPDEIPNLFFGFPQPQPHTELPEAFRKAQAPDETHLTPKPERIQPDQSNFFSREPDTSRATPPAEETKLKRMRVMPPAPTAPSPATDFSSRYTSPKDVVARAKALTGVAGALVALPDGLMVASQIPPELNPDTLAAFLPQIYGRVSQSTKELRMGELNNLNFTVGNVPWKIFRIHGVFFAAFGRAGEQLPTGQLARLAAELDRKKH